MGKGTLIMGKEYVLLSMLKEKKIDYYYLPKDNIVLIPCPTCDCQIRLCTITTNWKCGFPFWIVEEDKHTINISDYHLARSLSI